MASASVDHLVRAVREAMRVEAKFTAQFVDWSEVEGSDFVDTVQRHRVAGLLIAHQSAIGMPEQVAAPVHELAVAEAHGGLLLTGQTRDVVGMMNHAGIPHLVMKGAALSSLTTGRAAARGSGDVDLLVRARDVMAAHAALRDAGFARWSGFELAPGPWWTMTRWLGRELPYRRAGSDVDVHWRVAYHDGLFPATEQLLMRGQLVTVGRDDVKTLSTSDSLAGTCFHAYFDRYARLRGLVDVLRLLRIPGIALAPDTTPKLRQLVSDTLPFVTSLIGDVSDIDRVHSIALSAPDPSFAEALWATSADEALWYAGITPMRDFGRLYRHQARYGRPVPSLVRFMAGRTLLLQDLDPLQGLPGIVKSATKKGQSIARHRLRRSG